MFRSSRNDGNKNILHVIIIQIIILLFCGQAFSASIDPSTNESDWNILYSNCFIIYYRPDANLAGIERELKTRTLYFDQSARYGEATVSDEICLRLDNLFSHVKDMLNMYPKIPKVNIMIFKDRAELNEEHHRVFSPKEDLRAYYVKDYNTIYTSESDIADFVMIHEMAHVIIDHYFPIAPPDKISELLASHVDQHIEE